ncbi:MAG: hypothetical protein Fur0037_07680 [Planctomycetota bacterium]
MTTRNATGGAHPFGGELDALLRAQLRALRRRALAHGLGAVLAVGVSAVLLAFLLDHWLRLPLAVRTLHSLLVATAVVGSAVVWIRRPLALRLRTVDMAVLLERRFPHLRQRLVSALQLGGESDLRNQSRAMIDALLAETREALAGIRVEDLFTARPVAWTWTAACGLCAVLAAGALLGPETAKAFVLRHLGSSASYPRATTLILELPPEGPELRREDSGSRSVLTLPLGSDLHVSVLAKGAIPDEVFLDVSPRDGPSTSIGMTRRGGARFRHVFHPVRGDFEFHARGGDDEEGDRLVSVRTIRPPAVAQIRAIVEPPPYTKEPRQVQVGGAIEGLAGSRVEILVTPTGAARTATISFLESNRSIEMAPTTIEDDSGKVSAFSVPFMLDESDRYEVLLLGDAGLRSPNPGTYPVTVVPDYAPVGRWLQPDDQAPPLLLPEGLLFVRIEMRDDHGLSGAVWTAESQGGKLSFPLLQQPAPAAEPARRLLAVDLRPVAELLGGAPRGAGTLSLGAVLTDNRQPSPSVTELPRRSIQIVDGAQLAVAIARAFRSMREQVERGLELQRDYRGRLEDVAESSPPESEYRQALTAGEVGQGRLRSLAQEVRRGLMRAFDVHVWNLLEKAPAAAAIPQLYATWFREHQDGAAFSPAFYRDLMSRRRAGTLGAMESVLDPILAMIEISDGLAEDLPDRCLRALQEAQVAPDARARDARVAEAVALQAKIEGEFERLLQRLDEWNDYQDLIQETRALRDRQKDVQERTRNARGDR